jgi:dienelactone hydrolase
LDGVVGAVVGGFEFAGRLVSGGGAVMETAVGDGAAEPFVEQEEEQRYLDAFPAPSASRANLQSAARNPGVHHAFDVAQLKPGRGPDGRWLEYDEPAARDAEKKTHAFFADHLVSMPAAPR